ncbi:MAG: autotransporter outer membrane beta-barrel domain-containing protein, partial [Snodgrassella alvi]
IYNNTGEITVNNNKEYTKINSHINNIHGGIITINNRAYSSTIEGDITNNNGRVTIENSGKVGKTGQDGEADTFLKITNSGGSINIKNDNDGDFLGNIDNDNNATGTGFIDIYNSGNTFKGSITNQNTGTIDITNRGKNFDGSITNQNTGNISITNDTTLNSTITNTGDKRTNGYNIEITNNKELNGSIKNEGTGDIHIKNTKDTSSIISRIGRITGEITNNNAGTIILDNDGEIANAILNGGAGAIKIANNGTLNGSITNTGDNGTDDNIRIENNKDGFINGDITNSGTGNISITNEDEAVLNSNIKNDGSGSIIFTNNGDVDANVVNNNPSVRINDTSLRQIQNTGNGKITIINNKTLNRPISNTSGGIINITNNSSMETDITNNTESSEGGITFKNKQEFKGKLINANSGSISATNTGTFTGVTTNSGSGILDLDNQGIWNNTGNSVLTKLENKTGTIIFPQVSEVNAGDKDQYHTITVNGNYTGGGLMRVNTVWNKDGTSYSDRVDIHGDVDGAATTVRTLNEKGIYGDVTLKEIPIHSAVVVHVAGKSSGNDFTGSAPTTNAGEAQLKKIDTTSGTDYAWTLTAQPKTPDPVVPVPPGPTVSDKPVPPAPPIKEVPIYAEPVSGYVQMPTADMELGFTTVGTLHERRGENQTYNITGSNNTALGDDQQQTWGRVLVKHLDKDGKKRLDTAGNQSVLQIGHDFILDENEKTGTRRHIGGYVAYGHNENDFRDEYRAKNGYIVDDHYTGKGRTDAVSVGGYSTFYGNNGGYVDLVGQVTYLRNKYNARSNESVHQNGWGAALSAETGKSFIVYGNNWFVEPQAQLVYQYLSLDDFNDRIRHVDQHDPSALRGRVGMRFGYNGDTRDNLPSSSFYGIANIWHDFVNPKSVDIGRDSLKEEYAKTWGELGLGIQLPITRQSDFYSDIRYEKNFGSDKRKGFKGTMGYKYTWL